MDLFAEESFHSISSSEEELHDNNSEVTTGGQNKFSDDTMPYVGQIFDTLEDAEAFYRKYAKRIGFEVRVKTSRKHVKSNDFCSRMYQCRKAGYKVVKKIEDFTDEEYNNKGKRRRDSIDRTECRAKFYVVHDKRKDKWVVSTLQLNHNHEFVSPSKVSQIQTHKNISGVARDLIETLNNAGIGPSRMMNVLSSLGGGMTNVGFSEKDLRNIVRDIRRDNIDLNDAQAAIDYLKKLQRESPSRFYFSVKLGVDNRIGCIMWVDFRSILAYQNFGDVVTFDTTYRTNKYSMPFAPFTGVNHHYHSVLFGCALLSDETEDTFVWLFEQWLEAMNFKHPITIVTDQDRAMSNVIARVLPNTHHALCAWHITKKYPEKLGHIYSAHPTFKSDFNYCVFKSLSIKEFEDRWNLLMENYCLHNHEWLKSLYDLKEKWVGVYSKNFFAAGMTTTSRSESMNSFFDEYVNSGTGIKDFVLKSQQAIEKQYVREKQDDYITVNRKRKILFGDPLEMHAAEIYTKEMFRRFQIELTKSHKLTSQKLHEMSTPDSRTYLMCKTMVPESCRRHFSVVHNVQTGMTKCNCKMFEHVGTLCRHILKLLTLKNNVQIPDLLIHKRWTKDANKTNGVAPYVLTSVADYAQTQTGRFNHLCKRFLGFVLEASCSREATNYVDNLLDREQQIVEKIPAEGVNIITDDSVQHVTKVEEAMIVTNDDDVELSDPVIDPICSQTKGRKKARRLKSAVEQIGGQKPLRKCATCGIFTNHDKRNHYKALRLKDP